MKNIHLIAIGGAIMHNLAIALKRQGHSVSGSDDAIYDPARSNLEKEGLLPEIGWNPEAIHEGIDQVILGMHARPDNPELLKAQALGLPIASFPEYVASAARQKTRLVVAGSHGKTSTTSMIMHVLHKAQMDFDYLVGSSIDGFELSVRLSDAPIIVIEGDEYLSSPIDRRSKFLWYDPDISIVTGIAYDHINVFPTFDSYLDTFRQYYTLHRKGTHLFWFKGDDELAGMQALGQAETHAYDTANYVMQDGSYTVLSEGRQYPMEIIGEHNLQNAQAAMLACRQLGIEEAQFWKLLESFSGAGRRMEKIYDKDGQVVYRDFAHSPSKLKATCKAVKDTYGSAPLLAVFELHTFSSLNKDFLPLYKDAMQSAEFAVVYVDAHVFEHRKMEMIPLEYIAHCFGDVQVVNDRSALEEQVKASFDSGQNILLMSSGTFSKAQFPFT